MHTPTRQPRHVNTPGRSPRGRVGDKVESVLHHMAQRRPGIECVEPTRASQECFGWVDLGRAPREEAPPREDAPAGPFCGVG